MDVDPHRVLYIEDEIALAQLVKRRLAREGFDVDCVSDGAEGLNLLQNQQYDAVIIDYKLPNLSGIEILEQLKQSESEVPAIMVSGHESIDIVIQAMQLNCRDYLVKDGNAYLELLPVHLNSLVSRRQL